MGSTWPIEFFGVVTNITYADGTRYGAAAGVAFETDAQSFQVLEIGAGSNADFDVVVDGKLVEGGEMNVASDGTLRFIKVDLSGLALSPGMHDIELVYNGGGDFGGMILPAGSSIKAIPDPGKRIVFLGDSFTEGTGALSTGQGFASLTGRALGFSDVWISGLGSTGWERSFDGRPSLEDRVATDGVAPQGDIYVIAMGLNDGDSPDIYAAVVDVLTKLTQGVPNAEIFVVAGWNVDAPNSVIYPTGLAEIESAAALFPQVHFLDPSGVAFTKFDGTHPDQAGHDVLAAWLTAQIENVNGTAAQHTADLLFQDTASGSIAGWQVSADAIIGGGAYGAPGSAWHPLAVADFTGGGGTDILFQGNDGTLATWTTNGITLFGGGVIGNPGADWHWLATADFNGDGKADLLFENAATGVYATWDLNGSQIVGGGAIAPAAGFTFVGTGDLNGDGKADLIFQDASGNLAAWLLNDAHIIGGGSIGNPGGTWHVVGVGDINGDGKSDLVFEDSSGLLAAWTMNGTQIIGGGTIGAPGGSWQVAKIADVNQDGKADIVFADSSGHYATWSLDGITITGGAQLGTIPGNLHLI